MRPEHGMDKSPTIFILGSYSTMYIYIHILCIIHIDMYTYTIYKCIIYTCII